MANDLNNTDKSTEIDDLASFGQLTSPDTEDSGFASEADPAEVDLASLASSTKANQNGRLESLSTENESTVDLSQAVETLDEDAEPIQETVSERVRQPSDASREQPTPIPDPNARARFEPEPADESRPNKSRTHWVLVLSIGFLLGLTTASISIFIFISMDRLQPGAPLSASSPIVANQRTARPPRASQTLDRSNWKPAPPQHAQPNRANTTFRSIAAPAESRASSNPTNRRERTLAGTRNRKRRPIDETIGKRLVEESSNQPISTADESADQSAKGEPTNPANATTATPSTTSQQPTAAASTDLDRIIDRVLDATQEDNIKESAARKASQKNAPQPSEQLPLVPSREQVTEAMAVLLPAIRGCAKGLSGLATANIIVLNTGKVANVTVSGSPFAGTASGYCIEGVVRKARFPRFRQPSFRIRFPFSIRDVPQ